MDNICSSIITRLLRDDTKLMIFVLKRHQKEKKKHFCDEEKEGKRHSMACDFKNHRLSLFILFQPSTIK